MSHFEKKLIKDSIYFCTLIYAICDSLGIVCKKSVKLISVSFKLKYYDLYVLN